MESSDTIITFKFVFLLVFVLVFLPLLPILMSGRWDWWQVWAYIAATIVSFVASRTIAVSLLTLLMLAQQVVAGFDGRFGLSPRFGVGVDLAALALLIIGYAFASWALIENAFFPGTVRIQTERGHSVVSTGP